MSGESSTAVQVTDTHNEAIASVLNRLQKDIHKTALLKGWWDGDRKLLDLHDFLVATSSDTELIDTAWQAANVRKTGELLALIHSEVSEALEADRHGNPPDDKIPEFSGVEAELADVMIRIFDAAEGKGWDVIGAMMAKIQMNKGRAYKHGKNY